MPKGIGYKAQKKALMILKEKLIKKFVELFGTYIISFDAGYRIDLYIFMGRQYHLGYGAENCKNPKTPEPYLK